jgi:hypothetical protein
MDEFDLPTIIKVLTDGGLSAVVVFLFTYLLKLHKQMTELQQKHTEDIKQLLKDNEAAIDKLSEVVRTIQEIWRKK